MHYPTAIHLQECYKDLNIKKGELPIAEELSLTELSLPIFYGMTEDQISHVCLLYTSYNTYNVYCYCFIW